MKLYFDLLLFTIEIPNVGTFFKGFALKWFFVSSEMHFNLLLYALSVNEILLISSHIFFVCLTNFFKVDCFSIVRISIHWKSFFSLLHCFLSFFLSFFLPSFHSFILSFFLSFFLFFKSAKWCNNHRQQMRPSLCLLSTKMLSGCQLALRGAILASAATHDLCEGNVFKRKMEMQAYLVHLDYSRDPKSGRFWKDVIDMWKSNVMIEYEWV